MSATLLQHGGSLAMRAAIAVALHVVAIVACVETNLASTQSVWGHVLVICLLLSLALMCMHIPWVAGMCRELRDQRYAAAGMRSMVHGIVLTDSAGHVVWLNAAAERLFGVEAFALLGRPCSELFVGADVERPLAFVCTARELVARRSDNTVVPVDLSLGAVQASGEQLVMLVLADATSRREAEHQRLQAQRLATLGSLVAGVAHEVGNPLQYIRNQVEFLNGAFAHLQRPTGSARTADTPHGAAIRDRVPGAVKAVTDGLDQIGRIVDSLRHYAHPRHTPTSSVDLHSVVRDALELTGAMWKPVAKVELDLASELPTVDGGPGELMQVFVNLLANAADAIATMGSPYAGRIRIESKRTDDGVVIAVADNGCGISPDVRSRVFDLFFTTKPPGKGTGQGLAIVQSILRDHGGSISFDSPPEGGTIFRVVVPVHSNARVDPQEALDAEHSVR